MKFLPFSGQIPWHCVVCVKVLLAPEGSFLNPLCSSGKPEAWKENSVQLCTALLINCSRKKKNKQEEMTTTSRGTFELNHMYKYDKCYLAKINSSKQIT